MPADIYYWDELIIDEHIADKYIELIQQLKDGQFQGTGLKLKKCEVIVFLVLATVTEGEYYSLLE